MDIYRASKRRGKFLPLATLTLVNSYKGKSVNVFLCFLSIRNQVALIAWHTILENALQSLRRIKTVKGSKANMWRNFGKVVIRGPDEGKLIDYDFSLL